MRSNLPAALRGDIQWSMPHGRRCTWLNVTPRLEQTYGWNLYHFGSIWQQSKAYGKGIDVEPTPQMIGAALYAWEQPENPIAQLAASTGRDERAHSGVRMRRKPSPTSRIASAGRRRADRRAAVKHEFYNQEQVQMTKTFRLCGVMGLAIIAMHLVAIPAQAAKIVWSNCMPGEVVYASNDGVAATPGKSSPAKWWTANTHPSGPAATIPMG